MNVKRILFLLFLFATTACFVGGKNRITVHGTKFEMNGEPFEYTGISFFNALYNPEFNRNSEIRKKYLQQFRETGINVLRVWCQWDNTRGFVDGGEGKTLYCEDGTLNPDLISTLNGIDDNRHWEVAAEEISYLIRKYQKPVVDYEPARKGTLKFGGPKSPTLPTDHILHMYNVWKSGGYVNYHHDMFQTGYGSEAIPPTGIPLPGFSSYHDEVFDFLKNKKRYLIQIHNK